MRTKAQIKSEITTAFMANETLATDYGFAVGASFEAEFSLVSFENILIEDLAFSIFLHEQMFDEHEREVNTALRNQKKGTKPWYRTMALLFQYGFDLVPDHDFFDNTGATAEEITTSMIVKYAAVNEATDSSRVIIKIAGENNGILSPITLEQLEAFEAYINEVRFAGVMCTVINFLPDRLFLNIQIKRDPLVLDANGMSILNANYPVNDAIKEFMKELPFDGELKLSALVDKLQLVPGVLDATVLNAQSSWIDPQVNGYGDPVQINISTIPQSGYFEVVTFDNISYVV